MVRATLLCVCVCHFDPNIFSLLPSKLAEQLLVQEVLNHADIVQIVGPMPHRKPFHPDTAEL